MNARIFTKYLKSCVRRNTEPDLKELEFLNSILSDWGRLKVKKF